MDYCISLTFVESEYVGRAYVAYGAVYICSSIIWMWIIEGNRPDKFDISGGINLFYRCWHYFTYAKDMIS